jgi:signal transduction histidine kinase
MEPAEVQRVFERFSRLDRHRDVAGSGLGLFVVKSVVSAHGGDIEVTSKVGEGTTIGVTFPANPPVNDRGEIISLDFAL